MFSSFPHTCRARAPIRTASIGAAEVDAALGPPHTGRSQRASAWALGAILIGSLTGNAYGGAGECVARSSTPPQPVVELFTSEGCSSCPPADQWLSRVRNGAPGRQAPIILSLHVDYWNDLGWSDPWSQRRFTERQQRYSEIAASQGVYTPQVLVSGKELRDWRNIDNGETLNQMAQVAGDASPVPTLDLTLLARSEQALRVRVNVERQGIHLPPHTTLVLARTLDALDSRVTAGENRDHVLHHDGVVNDWVSLPLTDQQESVSATLALRPVTAGKNAHLVAFLQDPANGRVLQALSLPIDNCHP